MSKNIYTMNRLAITIKPDHTEIDRDGLASEVEILHPTELNVLIEGKFDDIIGKREERLVTIDELVELYLDVRK